MKYLLFLFLASCVSELSPSEDGAACRAYAAAIQQKASECKLVYTLDIDTWCENRTIVWNTDELRNKCIPEIQADTCAEILHKQFCSPIAW
jgi:hypothetical protein